MCLQLQLRHPSLGFIHRAAGKSDHTPGSHQGHHCHLECHLLALRRAREHLARPYAIRGSRINRTRHIVTALGLHKIVQALADGAVGRCAGHDRPMRVHIGDHALGIGAKNQLLHAAHQHRQIPLVAGNAGLRRING